MTDTNKSTQDHARVGGAVMAEHTPGPWKLILHGNETYPFPLSIQTEDGASWIARDGTVSSLANAALLASAPTLQAENTALKARVAELEWIIKGLSDAIDGPQNPNTRVLRKRLKKAVTEWQQYARTTLAQGENDG